MKTGYASGNSGMSVHVAKGVTLRSGSTRGVSDGKTTYTVITTSEHERMVFAITIGNCCERSELPLAGC